MISMSQWLLPVSLFIASSNGGSITCSNVGECRNQIVNCPNDDSTCFIICATGGCLGTTINCLDGYLCQVQTGGDNSARLAKINGNAATQLNVFTGTSGTKQLEEAKITCPNSPGAYCFVSCEGGGYQNCREMYLDAEMSSTLWLSCDDSNEACVNVEVRCPNNNVVDSCILDGQVSTAAMTGMKIYSQNGFRTMRIYDGVSSSSIGWMYCLKDYSASCQIDANPHSASSQMACITSGSQICDNPETFNPTVYPTTATPTTADPTTSLPTTSNPTTSTPTTSNPTTSAPTTSAPTSATPTTSSPSTSIPTTAIPTTSIPTTSFPTTLNPTTIAPTTYTLNPTTNGLDVDVTENDLLNHENDKDVFPEILIWYILIISLLIMCCCTLICFIGRQYKLDVVEMEKLNHKTTPVDDYNTMGSKTCTQLEEKMSAVDVIGKGGDVLPNVNDNKEVFEESSSEDMYGNANTNNCGEQNEKTLGTSGDKMVSVLVASDGKDESKQDEDVNIIGSI